MNPKDVNPGNFKVNRIVYTSPKDDFSIAIGEWTEDEMNRFALRWNYDINNPDDIGFPNSHGHPVWFQLPYDIRDMLKVLIEHSNPMEI